jgi:hypothetical protein
LPIETRHEARALVIDVACERRTEVARHQKRTRAGAMLDRRPSALARVLLVETRETVPFRMIDLQCVMQDIAAEQRLLTLGFEFDADGSGVWPGAGVTLRPCSISAPPFTMWAMPASTTGSTESRNEPPLAGPFCGILVELPCRNRSLPGSRRTWRS